jgi:hypothetical protein
MNYKHTKTTAISLVVVVSITTIQQPTTTAQAAVPAFVQTCLSNPYCAAAAVILGGATYWGLTQNGDTSYYTEDPEAADDEWFDYIWADSGGEAIRKCRQYADNNGVIYLRVRKVGRGKKYECIVRPMA